MTPLQNIHEFALSGNEEVDSTLLSKAFLYAGLRKPLVFLSLPDHCQCVYNDIAWVVGGKRYLYSMPLEVILSSSH